ncbi:TraR/DksA family transcriptional regulator [Leisingera methylohalidivorans]|uniref:Molecular chaperone DnaK n=1 Tax=Leisingera methylohalidivorans DSM 14336 TaxID=999552 RepID=V9VU61_9RHOB|nr:TraR/DksA C4-type zinc finger protein [Leisingera methylohalidivorans]AHD00845.1 molecular chaperone DnaK [Leisingera methylohalidivorans DSM 14336]
MNESAQAALKLQITARLKALAAEDTLGEKARGVVELDQQMVGRLSRMDALQMQAMARAQAARRAVEAQRLQSALARMDAKEYGYCENCGEDIAPKRLQLYPAALKCMSCASG